MYWTRYIHIDIYHLRQTELFDTIINSDNDNLVLRGDFNYFLNPT